MPKESDLRMNPRAAALPAAMLVSFCAWVRDGDFTAAGRVEGSVATFVQACVQDDLCAVVGRLGGESPARGLSGDDVTRLLRDVVGFMQEALPSECRGTYFGFWRTVDMARKAAVYAGVVKTLGVDPLSD